MYEKQLSMARITLFLLFILLTTKSFGRHDTLCGQEIIVALKIYHQNLRDSGLSSTTYINLQKFRDIIALPSNYVSCKQRSSFWSYYAKLNFELANNPHIDTATKLVYLEAAITANTNAILLNNDTISTHHELPILMLKTFELQSNIYYRLRDSSGYYTAIHKSDSTRFWISHRTSAKVDTRRPVKQFDKPAHKSLIITIFLYNDSINKFYIDSTFSSQILATTISTGEKYTAIQYADGKFRLELPSNKYFAIEVSRPGYATQVRNYQSISDGEYNISFNLSRSGVSFYNTPSGQIPFQRNDKLISIIKVQSYKRDSFAIWIKKMGLVQCSGDSIFLFRKANGHPFDCLNDSMLLLLRSNHDKVEWAGPLLNVRVASTLTVLNSIYIVLSPSHVLLPAEKKMMDKILARGKLKSSGDGWYLAPESIGICLNDIANELNQLSFVWYATIKTISKTQTF